MNKIASASAMQISKRDDSWYVTLISTLLQKNATILYVRSLLPPCPHGALQSNISESPTDRECRCTVRFVPISSKTSKILCEEPDITMKYHDRMVIYIYSWTKPKTEVGGKLSNNIQDWWWQSGHPVVPGLLGRSCWHTRKHACMQCLHVTSK